ncbi:MAG TPA: glycosyltransferase family 39 protein [bacterium]|nr:glycosyltransferase family 39 protein [bacterium]
MLSSFSVSAAVMRFVDADEGYYLLAARLIHNGERLYRDFFYTQAPGLPYLFSVLFNLPGSAWLYARIFAAGLNVVCGLVIYQQVKKTSSAKYAVWAAALFFFSSWILEWHSTIKTFAPATLFALSSFYSLQHLQQHRSAMIVSGVLLSFAILMRSTYGILIPCALYAILPAEKKMNGGKFVPLCYFLFGLAIGFSPLIVFFSSWENFMLGNVGYHAMRSEAGLIGNFQDKCLVLGQLLGIKSSGYLGREATIQLGMLIIALLFFIGRNLRKSKIFNINLLIVLALTFIHFLPTPCHPQYFTSVIPFLILYLFDVSSDLTAVRTKALSRPILSVISIFALTVYFSAGLYTFYRISISGEKMPGLWPPKHHRQNWKISSISEISQVIDAHTGTTDFMASWPGFAVETKARILSGLENHFGLEISDKLNPNIRRQSHIKNYDELIAFAADHRPVIVSGIWGTTGRWLDIVNASGCQSLISLDYVQIYR